MNIENTKAQMRKGILEFCILSLIKRREMYVLDLMEELKKADMEVVEGTLYPLLTRLKNAEILSYRWEESTGELFIAELDKTWNQLVESVTQITKNQ